ncbi:DUF2069 domain-containing protein [Motilimonas pumila]|nr:DUF2069 domain-containing protein [Motilimonas pumila]
MTQQFRKLALFGYFGLWLYIPLWHLWLSPPSLGLDPWFVLSIWLIPLIFPLRGLLKGNPYTYAWTCFISLWYFLHSLTIMVSDPAERWLAVGEFFLAVCFFCGCAYYAKHRGRELGLSIRKPKNKAKQ